MTRLLLLQVFLMEIEWNVVEGCLNNHCVEFKNNPQISGKYLCTCILHRSGCKDIKYLQVMEYDSEKNYWHDVGHRFRLSHIVFAWADVDVCDFEDYQFHSGGWISLN